MENKVEAPSVWLKTSYHFPALLGATVVGGCAALYLCHRWKHYVEGTFHDLNSSIEEVTESVSYIKHRLKTRDCCACHDVASASGMDEHGADEHHCDKTEFFKLIDGLLESHYFDVEEAYYLMKGRLSENRDDPTFLIRMARAAHTLGLRDRIPEGEYSFKKKMYLNEAHKYAALALKLNRTDPDTNKWHAITLGNLTAILPFRQRIHNLSNVKTHVERALEMNKKDAILHHILGRWHFQVATMSFPQRTAAWLCLGFSHTSTLSEARQHFIRSYNLLPTWKENHFYIAKTHALQNQPKNAIRWAQRGLALPSKTAVDSQTEAEIGMLLERLLETVRATDDDRVDTSTLD